VDAASGAAGRRHRRHVSYELIGCGLHGHALAGTTAASLRPEDAIFALPGPPGVRWYRCLRCDAWVVLRAPVQPTMPEPPDRGDITLPLRGRPLRDRYVLRLIAVDRAVHVLVLTALAVAVFAFASHRGLLHHEYTRILSDLQGGLGGPIVDPHSVVVSDFNHLFALSTAKLYLAGVAIAAYTALLAVEMVGLWFARRWAEYLTFAETAVLVPFEIYELTRSLSYLKIITLVLNLAIVIYLLFAHRLFGLRGGGAAERAAHERDSGWAALERATPTALVAAPAGAAGHGATRVDRD